jgi:hypothetical protein
MFALHKQPKVFKCTGEIYTPKNKNELKSIYVHHISCMAVVYRFNYVLLVPLYFHKMNNNPREHTVMCSCSCMNVTTDLKIISVQILQCKTPYVIYRYTNVITFTVAAFRLCMLVFLVSRTPLTNRVLTHMYTCINVFIKLSYVHPCRTCWLCMVPSNSRYHGTSVHAM